MFYEQKQKVTENLPTSVKTSAGTPLAIKMVQSCFNRPIKKRFTTHLSVYIFKICNTVSLLICVHDCIQIQDNLSVDSCTDYHSTKILQQILYSLFMVVYNSKGPNKMMKENQCYCFTSVHLKSPYNNVLTVHHCFQEKKIVKSSRERKKNSTLEFQNVF